MRNVFTHHSNKIAQKTCIIAKKRFIFFHTALFNQTFTPKKVKKMSNKVLNSLFLNEMENQFFSYKIKHQNKLYKAYCFFIENEIYVTQIHLEIDVLKMSNRKILQYGKQEPYNFYKSLEKRANIETDQYGIVPFYYVYFESGFKNIPLELFIDKMGIKLPNLSIKDYFPTYKLISTYPNCPYILGQEFNCSQKNEDGEFVANTNEYSLNQSFFEQYSNLFSFIGMQKEINHLLTD